MSAKLLNRLRHLFALGHDGIMAGVSFLLALYLRWGDAMWEHSAPYLLPAVAGCITITLCLVIYTRLYRRLWRYVSLKDLHTIVKIATVAIGLFYLALFLTTRLEMLPRSIPFIHWLLLLTLLCAPRFLKRALHEKRLQLPERQQVPVLLIGATAEAELFIRESMRSPSFAYRIVGVASDDGQMIGRNIHHIKVYGPTADIPAILRKLRRKGDAPQRVILADPTLSGEAVRSILTLTEPEGLPLARMPRLTDLTDGAQDKLSIQPIEVEDILGRPQATLDRDAMRSIVEGKVVLITGAGGSIGSELVRQVASFAPRRIVLFELSEYALYRIDRELQEQFPDVARKAVLADIRDAEVVAALFAEHRPQVVFHAAALKHVPLCEINILEAIRTNIVGTRIIADACVSAKVELMVQISTDKAVNPTNIMGACKRAGESYCQALGQAHEATRFITVRFGNVLGSTGSVVPLFQRQLEQGGPLTITHKEMTRYFMTIREAVQLVIQSAALGLEQNEQVAPIFVLDMGEPIRIEDLALQMIRLAGLRPHQDIALSYVGLRPGEKLHEELFYDAEGITPTDHTSIHLAAARDVPLKPLMKKLDQLANNVQKQQQENALALIQELVPEYKKS